jgi:HSP20 family protein
MGLTEAHELREPERVMQKERRENSSGSSYTLGKSLRRVWSVMQEMSRMMDMAHGAEALPVQQDMYATQHWEPVATQMPAGDDLMVYLELPGVEYEDIDLTLHGSYILVSGVRKEIPSLKNVTVEDFVSGNLDLGPVKNSSFKSRIELPRPVAEEDVEAAFGAELLQIRVADAAENRPRQIHIRAAKKPRS